MIFIENLKKYTCQNSSTVLNVDVNGFNTKELDPYGDFYDVKMCLDEEYLRQIAESAEKIFDYNSDPNNVLLYFLSHIKYGDSIHLSTIIIEFINKNVMYKGEYRVPYLDIYQIIISNNNLNDAEKALLNIAVLLCYSKPGIVGTSTDLYKLKEHNEYVDNIILNQRQGGPDGFNSEYLISQMKGGLSVDLLIGCPMGCTYCYRIDSDYSNDYVEKWHPEKTIEPEIIIDRLLKHPWFTPHVTPLGIHMSTTEAFLPRIWPLTVKVLEMLENYKLTNRISIITKWTLNEEQVKYLERFKFIDLDICVCYSGMPVEIEPSSSKKRLLFLKRLVETTSPHIHAISYYRPIVEGYNTSNEIIGDVVEEIKKTGVKTVVLGGLKFSSRHKNYFLSQGLQLPEGEFISGKKNLNKETVDKIINKFKQIYEGDSMPNILMRSSCARIMARGNKYQDYNAHWTNKEKNCMLNCDHYGICSKSKPPKDKTIHDLLERINKSNTDFKIINNSLVVFDYLTMYEKTFITQNISYPVMDLYDIETNDKCGKFNNKSCFCEMLCKHINENSDEKSLLSFLKLEKHSSFNMIVSEINDLISTQDVSIKLWLETKWSFYMNKNKSKKSPSSGINLVLNCVLDILDEYINAFAKDTQSPEYVWAINDRGREFIHLFADKLFGLDFVIQIKDTDGCWINYADAYYNSNDYDKYTDIRKIGYVLIIKSLLSKYYVSKINHPVNIGIVVPMYNETDTLTKKNALIIKYEQLEWLTKNSNVDFEFKFIDDFDDNNSYDIAMAIADNYPKIKKKIDIVSMKTIHRIFSNDNDHNNPVLKRNDCHVWKKGGSVLWGLYELAYKNNDYVAFCDCDLLYPLEQLGLLLNDCINTKGVSVGSRKVDDSFGYYNSSGINKEAYEYQTAINELINIDIRDVQAGFKCMNSRVVLDVIPNTVDRDLSFDVELLSLAQKNGYSINEIGVLTLHEYKEGNVRTHRIYQEMLKNACIIENKHKNNTK